MQGAKTPREEISQRLSALILPAAPTDDAAVLSAVKRGHATQDRTEPRWITVHQGDTLSSLSRQYYGHASRWPELWWKNRGRVHNPSLITTGETLRLTAWHPRREWALTRAMEAIPKPPKPKPVRAVVVAAPVASPAPQQSPDPAPAAPAQSAPVQANSGFQSCVIQAESGGNASAVNASSGAGGLYGFLPSTWASLGHSGLPENASVAEQNDAFWQEYDQNGTSPWAPYDGC